MAEFDIIYERKAIFCLEKNKRRGKWKTIN